MTPVKLPTLATVYLDNEPVGLMGDPRPRVSKIVVAGGKRPELVQVLRARSANDPGGQPVGLEEVIDRTAEPTVAVYLTCVSRAPARPTPTNLPAPPRAPSTVGSAPEVPVPMDGNEPRLPSPIAPLKP